MDPKKQIEKIQLKILSILCAGDLVHDFRNYAIQQKNSWKKFFQDVEKMKGKKSIEKSFNQNIQSRNTTSTIEEKAESVLKEIFYHEKNGQNNVLIQSFLNENKLIANELIEKSKEINETIKKIYNSLDKNEPRPFDFEVNGVIFAKKKKPDSIQQVPLKSGGNPNGLVQPPPNQGVATNQLQPSIGVPPMPPPLAGGPPPQPPLGIPQPNAYGNGQGQPQKQQIPAAPQSFLDFVKEQKDKKKDFAGSRHKIVYAAVDESEIDSDALEYGIASAFVSLLSDPHKDEKLSFWEALININTLKSKKPEINFGNVLKHYLYLIKTCLGLEGENGVKKTLEALYTTVIKEEIVYPLFRQKGFFEKLARLTLAENIEHPNMLQAFTLPGTYHDIICPPIVNNRFQLAESLRHSFGEELETTQVEFLDFDKKSKKFQCFQDLADKKAHADEENLYKVSRTLTINFQELVTEDNLSLPHYSVGLKNLKQSFKNWRADDLIKVDSKTVALKAKEPAQPVAKSYSERIREKMENDEGAATTVEFLKVNIGYVGNVLSRTGELLNDSLILLKNPTVQKVHEFSENLRKELSRLNDIQKVAQELQKTENIKQPFDLTQLEKEINQLEKYNIEIAKKKQELLENKPKKFEWNLTLNHFTINHAPPVLQPIAQTIPSKLVEPTMQFEDRLDPETGQYYKIPIAPPMPELPPLPVGSSLMTISSNQGSVQGPGSQPTITFFKWLENESKKDTQSSFHTILYANPSASTINVGRLKADLRQAVLAKKTFYGENDWNLWEKMNFGEASLKIAQQSYVQFFDSLCFCVVESVFDQKSAEKVGNNTMVRDCFPLLYNQKFVLAVLKEMLRQGLDRDTKSHFLGFTRDIPEKLSGKNPFEARIKGVKNYYDLDPENAEVALCTFAKLAKSLEDARAFFQNLEKEDFQRIKDDVYQITKENIANRFKMLNLQPQYPAGQNSDSDSDLW